MSKHINFEPRWLVVIIFFLSGIFLGGLGLFIWVFNGGNLLGIQKVNSTSSNYKFINPLLEVDTSEKKVFFENQLLQDKINKVISDKKKTNGVSDVSVYFRDLIPGRWVGINEDANFSPGRLLKVPIMIAYLKNAESNPGLLDKYLSYNQHDAALSDSNNQALVTGDLYTVSDLIKTMILQDDNNAALVLFDNIDKNALGDVYTDLGINFKENVNVDDYISTKSYSLFFRILYNATYLDRDMSELALSILSQAKDTEGMSVSLPHSLAIAHKFRSRSYVQKKTHYIESVDCGIIYYPKHPYTLCVVVKGEDANAIQETFRDISLAAYEDMDALYKFSQSK